MCRPGNIALQVSHCHWLKMAVGNRPFNGHKGADRKRPTFAKTGQMGGTRVAGAASLIRWKANMRRRRAHVGQLASVCNEVSAPGYCDIPPVLFPAPVSIEIKNALRSVYENLWPATSARCSM